MTLTIDTPRLDELLRVIITAAGGDYTVRVPLADVVDDAFLELEVGVNFLLEELTERLAQTEAQRDQIIANARQLREQQDELVAALSTPIITVWRGVLVLPLIGQIDATRASAITTKLLDQVTRERASHVILDLTGVGTVSPSTMPAILGMVRALGLLGATCLLTGIQPALARQLVAVDAGKLPIRTLAHLSDALALVLTEAGARPS